MVDTATKIMAEVLNLIGIATKEIKQGRTSTSFCTMKFRLTEPFSEKYLKKLFGNRTDIDDALKRLDSLTQEEARMASAQLLQITSAIDSEVRGFVDNVIAADDRVAGVDDRVANVDDHVNDVDDKVKAVDDKLVAVIDGAQLYVLSIIVELSNP